MLILGLAGKYTLDTGVEKMAYMTQGLSAMQVYSNIGDIITLRERTRAQIYRFMRGYMTDSEIAKYEYISGSQFVSENNGFTYAKFRRDDSYIVTLAIYNNPELG